MRAIGRIVIAGLFSMTSAGVGSAQAQEALSVYAAGSLRAPLTELGAVYKTKTGVDVRYTFGASGLLKERIEKGEGADIFASANTEHPEALAKAGLAEPLRVFTRNEMCALVAPKIDAKSETLIDAMLNPAVKLGTSTPKADPSGDYAWQVFEKVEKLRAGSFAKLDAKALKLTGGKDSPPPPANKNVYAELTANGQADVFLTYCTNASLATKEQPQLRSVALPKEIAVGADYGIATLKRAPANAKQYVGFLLSADAQAVFARFGFAPLAAGKSASSAETQASTGLSIELPGAVAKQFSRQDLEKLERKTAAIMIRDKGPFQFAGATVFSILEAAGYKLDEPKRGAYLTQYVVITATDGYRVVYSMGEFDPKSKREAPLLVWQQDGSPLKETEGPYRLVIPDNAHTSRWIRQIKSIAVRSAE
jgi:molybdate transport system substrate-binding protein